MQNQQQNPKRPLSARLMYTYATKGNIPWEFSQYQPLKKYEKGKQALYIEKKPTKKGSFMDFGIKVAQDIPSPQHYQPPKLWSSPSKHPPQLDSSLKKYTYLDLIQTQQKNRKKPGPGQYQIFKSQEEIQKYNKQLYAKSKKRSNGQKRYFYQDEQFLSDQNPGPGNYNPRPIKKKIKAEKKNHKYWIEKHEKQNLSFRQKKKKQPDVGTYTPLSLQYNTFHRYSQVFETKDKKQKKITRKPWGSAERFDYAKKINPSRSIQKRPQPGTYQLILDWPQKLLNNKTPKKRVDWINKLSRTSVSVYN